MTLTTISVAQDQADAEPAPLRVGISHFPPFVILEEGATPQGFDIELWKAVARGLGRQSEFVELDGVKSKIDGVAGGSLDVAIGGISMTLDRESRVDFSYPSFRTGLGILARAEETGWGGALWYELTRPRRLAIIGGFLVLIVVSGHLMWMVERGKEAFNNDYKRGVWEGMYWAIVTASTVGYGDKAPIKWSGRLLAGIVIIVSLPLFSLFTAELASSLTVREIQASINGPDDLRGRRVAVIEGTTAEEWIATSGARRIRVASFEDGTRALRAGAVEAFVHDMPALQFFALNETDQWSRVAGTSFEPQNYAFALPEGSDTVEDVNRELLRVFENGQHERHSIEWFGE